MGGQNSFDYPPDSPVLGLRLTRETRRELRAVDGVDIRQSEMRQALID
jgi:hypothetical protein